MLTGRPSGKPTLWFCRTGVSDAQNASLEGLFGPNVLKTERVGPDDVNIPHDLGY